MADLATCYFCGGVDGVEEHPVIPEEMDPPADDQRTVAVCPDCRLKFDRAVEPFVSLLREAGSSDGEDSLGDQESTVPGGHVDDTAGADGDPNPIERPHPANESEWERDDEVEGDEGSGDTEAVELPDASRDVLRLLQNRAFPVPREEIETVAETAYELGPVEAREAIDALVEYGVLEEENGQLDRSE